MARKVALAVCLVALTTGSFALGSEVTSLRIVKNTYDGSHGPEPAWMLTVDRSMLVDLTSEESVAECEASFREGATGCSRGYGCFSLVYTPDAAPFMHMDFLPWACDESRPVSASWLLFGPLGPIRAIPIVHHD